MFVGIAGLIGVGKSTLTEKLAAHLGDKWQAVYEPVETNPYLEDFYKDIRRWTFNMQMFLLCNRFRQHQEVLWNPVHREGGGVVQDRTIYEDTIFARMHREDGLMDDRDWDTYISHFEVMKGFLRYPDVILYLRITPDEAMRRIRERGRSAEQGIEQRYIERLFEGYEAFAEEMRRYTVLVPLDWAQYGTTEEVMHILLERSAHDQKFIRSLRRI